MRKTQAHETSWGLCGKRVDVQGVGGILLNRRLYEIVWGPIVGLSKADIEHRIEAFVGYCRARGLKVTHQRTEIFREVVGSESHPDAETVYQAVRSRIRSISRDTVYRTLAALEGEGFIRRAGALDGAARYDANTERHHHFVCTVCGAIKDFSSAVLDDLPIPESVQSFGRVESSQVQVRGVCSACEERQGEKVRPV